MDTRMSLKALMAAEMLTAGTHTTTSHHLALGRIAFSSSANFLVSVAVLFIFQLPAMMVLRYLRFIIRLLLFLIIIYMNEMDALNQTEICFYLSSRQATPGSSLPSINSREAPPPVEIWVILSA